MIVSVIQARFQLAQIYKNVIATDTSQGQLDFAPPLPNVRYQCTPPDMSLSELKNMVSEQGSVDLVLVAQAMALVRSPSVLQTSQMGTQKAPRSHRRRGATPRQKSTMALTRFSNGSTLSIREHIGLMVGT